MELDSHRHGERKQQQEDNARPPAPKRLLVTISFLLLAVSNCHRIDSEFKCGWFTPLSGVV
jgi:hypothetical protein